MDVGRTTGLGRKWSGEWIHTDLNIWCAKCSCVWRAITKRKRRRNIKKRTSLQTDCFERERVQQQWREKKYHRSIMQRAWADEGSPASYRCAVGPSIWVQQQRGEKGKRPFAHDNKKRKQTQNGFFLWWGGIEEWKRTKGICIFFSFSKLFGLQSPNE